MQKRYDELLTARLEDAVHNGCAHITWNELYLWYDVKKIAARTWRDLDERMKDLSGNTSSRPRKIEGRGGVFIFDYAKARRINPDVAR